MIRDGLDLDEIEATPTGARATYGEIIRQLAEAEG